MEIENVKVYDMDESICASKYPMSIDTDTCTPDISKTVIKLASSKKGEGHDNFLNGILVSFDLTFSLKAWIEAKRYHFLDFVSSQSTMHRITQMDLKKQCNKYVWHSTITELERAVVAYNALSDKNSTGAKEQLLAILYNIPSGLELTARMTTNYRQLKTIYSQRKYHRLPEWRQFCEWIETLPNSHLLITNKGDNYEKVLRPPSRTHGIQCT